MKSLRIIRNIRSLFLLSLILWLSSSFVYSQSNGEISVSKVTATNEVSAKGLTLSGDGGQATIDSKIDGTIVFGGEDGTNLANTDIASSYYAKYAVWIEHGIVVEDIAFAGCELWDADNTDTDTNCDAALGAGGVPDYVFAPDYQLRSLEEVQSYIQQYRHLPEIPSAKEVTQNGYSLIKMEMGLLKKVEELTLYTIDQEKKIREQNELIEELKGMLLQINSRLEKLDK